MAIAYPDWLSDFERRLSLHDLAVVALARDLATRTDWHVSASGTPDFPAADEVAGTAPDVLCRRGGDRPPLCLEVELPETIVRRETLARLRRLVAREALDTRLVLIGAASDHERDIRDAARLLSRADLEIPVAAIAPQEETITGADW